MGSSIDSRDPVPAECRDNESLKLGGNTDDIFALSVLLRAISFVILYSGEAAWGGFCRHDERAFGLNRVIIRR